MYVELNHSEMSFDVILHGIHYVVTFAKAEEKTGFPLCPLFKKQVHLTPRGKSTLAYPAVTSPRGGNPKRRSTIGVPPLGCGETLSGPIRKQNCTSGWSMGSFYTPASSAISLQTFLQAFLGSFPRNKTKTTSYRDRISANIFTEKFTGQTAIKKKKILKCSTCYTALSTWHLFLMARFSDGRLAAPLQYPKDDLIHMYER